MNGKLSIAFSKFVQKLKEDYYLEGKGTAVQNTGSSPVAVTTIELTIEPEGT